jgi:FAD/FMN-containing dehydrogenase
VTHALQLSYSGLHEASPEVAIPADLAALRAILDAAAKAGRRVTVRGAGMSLDSHAIGSDLSLVMTAFDRITVDEAASTVTAGVGAPWGEVLARLEPLGLVPKVMISTKRATVGGTLSANSLSRFSCIHGREGASIRSIQLVTADGELRTCSRTDHPDLFHAVIGGYGHLGVVIEATYELLKLPCPVQVETRFAMRVGVEGLAETLRPRPDDPTLAICAVLALYGDTVRQLYTTSRYTTGPWVRPVWLYRPVSGFRVLVETIAYFWPWMSSVVWNVGFRYLLRDDVAYRDPVRGYTFFTDGNVQARERVLGLTGRYRMLEQTFIVPAAADLEGFIAAIATSCRELGVHPLIFDVTWLPEDQDFVMSSTRKMAGYAVNIAFVGTSDAQTPRVIRLFTELADRCLALGGRVHLTKNVFARPETLRAMYAESLATMAELGGRVDPTGTFRSAFLERVMGTAPRES